jgi:diguanylate cyclase (GGDEF)-like protein/PAS domain S-box-containing protein
VSVGTLRKGLATTTRRRVRPSTPHRLRENELNFRLIFDGASIGISLVSTDGRFLEVNSALCALVGYSRDELVGRTFLSITHPDDLDADMAHVQRCLDGVDGGYEMEKRYVHRDGRDVWVHLTVAAVHGVDGRPTHFVAQIMDISERRIAAEALAASEARFAAMVENGSDLIALTDPAGRLVYASPAYRTVLGFEPEERIGIDLLEGVHPDDVDAVVVAGMNLLSTPRGSCRLEFRFAHGDGSWRWMEATLTNRVDDPAVGGFVINTRDMTERVLAAERLAHQATHDGLTGLPNRGLLDERLTEADAAARSRGEMLAVVYIDVDHFKSVNDTYGHHVGDQLLVHVAERMRHAARSADVVARLGGDEFVIVASVADERAAHRLAERACRAFEEPFSLGGLELVVSGSAGVATNATTSDAESLLAAADRALYAAKAAGRATWSAATGPWLDHRFATTAP